MLTLKLQTIHDTREAIAAIVAIAPPHLHMHLLLLLLPTFQYALSHRTKTSLLPLHQATNESHVKALGMDHVEFILSVIKEMLALRRAIIESFNSVGNLRQQDKSLMELGRATDSTVKRQEVVLVPREISGLRSG